MKQSYLCITLLFSLFLFFTSCEKVIDIDDEGHQRQMVLNAIPMANKQAFIYFAHTHFFLDTNNVHPVSDANITLTINGIPYQPERDSSCIYFFNHHYRPLDELSLDIKTPEGDIHAETYVPRMPQISNLSVSQFAGVFNVYSVNFELSDSLDYPEYYMLSVIQRDSGMRYNPWYHRLDTIDTTSHTYFMLNNNPNITSNEVNPYIPMGGYLYSRAMFLDRKINGQKESIHLDILKLVDTLEVDTLYLDTLIVSHFKHWYTIRIESITPARWNYLLSASSASSMSSIFAEQSQAYSNVQGALGIFAGQSRYEYTFDVDTLPSYTTTSRLTVPKLIKNRF